MKWRDVRPGDVVEWQQCVDMVLATEKNVKRDEFIITLLLMWVKKDGYRGATIERLRFSWWEDMTPTLLIRGGQ